MKTIIRGRWLLQDAQNLIQDGAALIEGDQIREVDAWPTLRQRHPQAAVVGSDAFAVIPGLINAHHHSNGVSTFQHGIEDRLLELWLLSLAQRRPGAAYLATLLSAARLLRSGVTAVVDVHNGRGTAEAYKQNVQEALRAYDDSGMRVAFAAGMTEKNYLVWDDDERFLASLPPPLRAMAAARLPAPGALAIDDYFDIFDDLWRELQAHPRIALWFGPPGPQWVSDPVLMRIAERAEAYDVGIQTHLLESVYERYHGRRVYGQPTLLHLRDLGILSPRLSFAHGVWLSQAEIEVAAEAGVHVSHNPSSNLRLRAGIAPLTAMLAAGVNVGLGLDGSTLNDDDSMFSEMRLALNLHRAPLLSAAVPTVADIWRMATTGGARLLQAGARLGRLAPGYAADLVLLRLERMTWPWTAPELDPAHFLLARAATQDVDTVIVGGETLLRDGKLLRFDVAQAGQELAQMLAAAPYPQQAAEMVAALLPHLKAYYQQWEAGDLQPYTAYHSQT